VFQAALEQRALSGAVPAAIDARFLAVFSSIAAGRLLANAIGARQRRAVFRETAGATCRARQAGAATVDIRFGPVAFSVVAGWGRLDEDAPCASDPSTGTSASPRCRRAAAAIAGLVVLVNAEQRRARTARREPCDEHASRQSFEHDEYA
jgi:hypothetical protein